MPHNADLVGRYAPDMLCPKCLSPDVGTKYEANAHGYGCQAHRPPNPECCTFEHHHRVCRRCRYLWIQLPVTASPNGSSGADQ